ncbi:hypothetical protein Hamer_G020141, partial [Homarus americanus]
RMGEAAVVWNQAICLMLVGSSPLIEFKGRRSTIARRTRLRVLPGTYVVLPCDPTITARPVALDDYLDRFDLPPQQHLDLGPQQHLDQKGPQQYHDIRALHIELGPQQPPHDPGPQHVDLGFQKHDPGYQHVNLGFQTHDQGPQYVNIGPQRHSLGPWQLDLGPKRLDLSQKDESSQLSAVPKGNHDKHYNNNDY